MAASSDTLILAAEERAKQGIHELEISFGGELDLHKHYNNCKKNPGHHNFTPINQLNKSHLPTRLIPWVRRISDFTVKLSVKYVSSKRPRRHPSIDCQYPLSDRGEQSLLSVGSGYVIDRPDYDKIARMECPFTKCGELPKNHKVCGYITVVTAAHVVFDDEEAKNTTVEFFYDDSDDRRDVVTARGVKVTASSVEGDFCELLCVTHDARLFLGPDYFWRKSERKEDLIGHLFRFILPGLKNISSISGENLKFLVNIRLKDNSEAVKALVVLGTLTEEVVDRALTNWNFGNINLRKVFRNNSLRKHNLFALINFELRIAELIDDNKHTASFSHLHSTLIDMQLTVRNMNTDSPQTMLKVFESLISELAQYYSTVESLAKRLSLYLPDLFDQFSLRNWLKVVNIRYGTATVEVSLLLRRYEVEYVAKLRALGMEDIFLCDDDENKSVLCESGDILVHIAHPHGQSKQVTIGRQTDCFTGHGFYHQLYTAPTCPGCSGGPVWMIPASGDLSQVYGVPHSRHYGNQLNNGSSWTLYPHKFRL